MRQLQPSLITSYKLSGILGPNNPDPEDFSAFTDPETDSVNVGADLYLMMEADVHKWCDYWGMGQFAAVDFLAQLGERIDELCATLKSKLDRVAVDVVATTSFVPEISNRSENSEGDYSETVWGRAIAAIFQIASALQSHREQTVVQMVAGSVLDQFRVMSMNGDTRFSVSSRKRTSLISLVLDRLSACLIAANSRGGVNTDRIRIALELEPGPLYLLQNKESLEEFSMAIDSHDCPLVRQCVGFNLDIAHWWLCRTLKTDIDVADHVRRKIYGGHIAGHSPRGHFGDFALTKLVTRATSDPVAQQQLEDYQMWLHFLADDSKTPNAAGHVSLEFEAAKHCEDIPSSLKVLKQWTEGLAQN